jgi:hypothetical protein
LMVDAKLEVMGRRGQLPRWFHPTLMGILYSFQKRKSSVAFLKDLVFTQLAL